MTLSMFPVDRIGARGFFRGEGEIRCFRSLGNEVRCYCNVDYRGVEVCILDGFAGRVINSL